MNTLLVGFFKYGGDKNRIYDQNTICLHVEKKPKNIILNIFLKLFYTITNYYLDFVNLNSKTLSHVNIYKPNIIIFHKHLALKKQTIISLRKKNIFTIFFIHDAISNPVNRSKNLLSALPYFNLIITTKSFELKLLNLFVNPNAIFLVNNFLNNSINKSLNLLLHSELEKKLTVISGFENERLEILLFLASNGVKIELYGGIEIDLWRKNLPINSNIILQSKLLKLEEYFNCIQNSFLIYSPLRKANSDLQTSRTVEIPFFGGILFTERTSEHLDMYIENQEAVFFESKEEILEKYLFLLNSPHFYNNIKIAGNKRAKSYNQDAYLSIINNNYKSHLKI